MIEMSLIAAVIVGSLGLCRTTNNFQAWITVKILILSSSQTFWKRFLKLLFVSLCFTSKWAKSSRLHLNFL